MTEPSRAKGVPWELFGGNHLREVLNAAPVGVMITSSDSRLLWLNRALRRQLDVVWPDVIGDSLNSLPLQPVDASAGGTETYQLPVTEQGDPINLRASVIELDTDGPEPFLLRFFIDAGPDGEGLRARVLQGLEFRRGRDAATGLLDRDAVMQVLDSEVARSGRYANPLSLLILRVRPDLHNAAPDAVVAAAGRILNEDLRWVDVAGRMTDTEFLLLLPETDADGAKVLADKLRARFSAQHDARPPVAASIAAATWREGDNTKLLLDRAVKRLDAHGGLS